MKNETAFKLSQEFCLDLYQPSGMGRRRRRRRRRRSQGAHEGQVEYFYPVSRQETSTSSPARNNSRSLVPSAANINDNVGVTVIMPEGNVLLKRILKAGGAQWEK